MTNIQDALASQLAKQLLPSEPSQLVGRRRGSVLAVNAGPPRTVDVALGTTTLPGVKYLESYSPAAGDNVFVDFTGPDPLVVGRIAVREPAWIDAGAGQGNTWQSLRGLDLYHPTSTPHIDFHRAANAAGDSNADYNVRLINDAAGWLHLVGSGGFYVDGLLDAGIAKMGTHPIHTSWAWFGHEAKTASANYQFLAGSNGETIVSSENTTYIRAAGALDRIICDVNGEFLYGSLWLRDNRLNCRGWSDTLHGLNYGGTADGVEISGNANAAGFYSGGGWDAFIGNSVAGIRVDRGHWLRTNSYRTGFYNNSANAGLFGTNDTFQGSNLGIETQNGETQILAKKISQGGWATAGIESFGESSSMVPWMTLHASGCCTSSWRKDSGQSYMVVINSGGGCDWVYAANHPICSEEARKRNIEVVGEYGLKQLRALKPKRFQYQPVDESEIWAWELWKHDAERGYWKYPPNKHMHWDTWHIGYMAEEMANLVPEVVGYYADGRPKGIDYGNLVVVVIEAVNELADRVEDLEARLEAMHRAAA